MVNQGFGFFVGAHPVGDGLQTTNHRQQAGSHRSQLIPSPAGWLPQKSANAHRQQAGSYKDSILTTQPFKNFI